MHPPRVELICDGKIHHANLRRELMTESQLRRQLRHKGVPDAAAVAEAWIEGSGEVSVLKKTDMTLADSLKRIEVQLGELRTSMEEWRKQAASS